MVGVSKFDWSGDRSTRDFASRNPREQRNGNGTDYASGQPRLGKHFLQHEQFGRLSFATLRTTRRANGDDWKAVFGEPRAYRPIRRAPIELRNSCLSGRWDPG